MYLKLILRGLLRHRASGRRLFFLLGLCSLIVLFCLCFRDSFVDRFQQLGIDTTTAHLQILPADSPKVQQMAFADQREGLSLIAYTPELQSFLGTLPGVTHAMPVIETRAAIFTMEGEQATFAPTLMGADPADLGLTLPGVKVLEGTPGLTWTSDMAEVPVYRPPLEFWEVIKDNDRFVRKNFRLTGAAWEQFKAQVLLDMPALFVGMSAPADDAFLAALNRALDRTDLPEMLPAWTEERYDYRIDDARAALAAREAAGPPRTPRAVSQVRVSRKRLLQSVYPEAITPVRDTIDLNVSYTMAVPAARGDDPLAKPALLPIRISAYVQRLPMFTLTYYVDGRLLRERLGLGDREATSIYIRLRSPAEVTGVRQEIARWLSVHQPGCVVRDYVELGSLFLSAASGFGILTLVLVVLFMATVTIFMVNTVLVSLIKRRREIGTSIAIGLSPGANVFILFGETLALVLVSWAAGAGLGTGLIFFLHGTGIPGIIFMPEGRLILDFRASHVAASLAIFVCSAAAASFVPLLRLARTAPVDLLKEAS